YDTASPSERHRLIQHTDHYKVPHIQQYTAAYYAHSPLPPPAPSPSPLRLLHRSSTILGPTNLPSEPTMLPRRLCAHGRIPAHLRRPGGAGGPAHPHEHLHGGEGGEKDGAGR